MISSVQGFREESFDRNSHTVGLQLEEVLLTVCGIL